MKMPINVWNYSEYLESFTKFAPPPSHQQDFHNSFFHSLGCIHLALILNGSMGKVAMLILGVTEPHPIENITCT
jgi:hypothetical protein